MGIAGLSPIGSSHWDAPRRITLHYRPYVEKMQEGSANIQSSFHFHHHLYKRGLTKPPVVAYGIHLSVGQLVFALLALKFNGKKGGTNRGENVSIPTPFPSRMRRHAEKPPMKYTG